VDIQDPDGSLQTFSRSPTQVTSCLESSELDCALLWGYLVGRTEAGYRRVHRSVANAATSPTG
jgi:hypothetical protein